MTKKELMEALEGYRDDAVVICRDSDGGWGGVVSVEPDGAGIAIVFGDGSSFSFE